jgi:GMP synthase PP-ATPase subunit
MVRLDVAPMTGQPQEVFREVFINKILKRKKHPKFKFTAENTIYARNIESSNNEESEFIILTKVGVHDYGKDVLKTMHC